MTEILCSAEKLQSREQKCGHVSRYEAIGLVLGAISAPAHPVTDLNTDSLILQSPTEVLGSWNGAASWSPKGL